VFKLTARARLRYDDCFSDMRNLFFSFFSSKRQLAVVTRRSDPKQKKREKRDLFFSIVKKGLWTLFVVGKRHEQRASRTERKDRQTEKK